MLEVSILDERFNRKILDRETLNMWEENDFIESPFIEIPNSIKMEEEIKIDVDLQYPKLGMKKAIKKCLIRKEAFERLLLACTLLPKRLCLKILDIYRPWSLQNELYYAYKPNIIKQFNLENLSEEEKDEIIKNYVSIPNKDEILPPLHTTGGSVDLTITDLVTGKDLDFGVGFDDFSDFTNTAAYESENSNELVRNNRRLLYNIMTEAGFTNLPSEIWHYDYGNRAWGYYKKRPAIYKGVLEVDEIKEINSFEKFIAQLNENRTNISCNLKKYNWSYSNENI